MGPCPGRSVLQRAYQKENVGEGAPEVCSIDVVTLLLGHVDLLAPRTEDLHSRSAYLLAHANRQSVLPFTQHPWTHSERPLEILLLHDGQTLGSDDVASMDQSVYVSGLLVYGQVSGLNKEYRSSYNSSSSGGLGLRIIYMASLGEGRGTCSGRTWV